MSNPRTLAAAPCINCGKPTTWQLAMPWPGRRGTQRIHVCVGCYNFAQTLLAALDRRPCAE